MKRIFTLIIAVTVTAVYAKTVTNDWRPLKADNRVIVQFPSAPQEVNGNFTVTDKSNITYTFKVVDFKQVFGIDSLTVAAQKHTPEFEAKLKAQIKKKLPGITLGALKSGVWKGFTTFASSGNYSSKKYNVFMFIIGNRLYTLSTLTPPGAATSSRDKFLASATLTR